MYIAFSVTITITMFYWNTMAGGISLAIVFLLAGLASEYVDKKGGDQ